MRLTIVLHLELSINVMVVNLNPNKLFIFNFLVGQTCIPNEPKVEKRPQIYMCW